MKKRSPAFLPSPTPMLALSGIAVAAVLFFAGCASFAGGAPRPAPIVIGAVGPFSGDLAKFGLATKKAYQMAVEERNAAGGILGRPLKLVFADDRGDPKVGAAAFARLIQKEGVVALLGSVTSKVSLEGAALAQAAGIPMISPTSSNPQVTKTGNFVFRACVIDPYQGRAGAEFAYGELKVRKAAVLFASDDEATKPLADAFKARFTALGGKIPVFVGYTRDTSDLKPFVEKALAAKPDLLYLPDYANWVASIMAQARELGFKGLFLGGDGWDITEVVATEGKAMEGGYFTKHFSPADTRPAVVDFAARYKARYGLEVDQMEALAYDAITLMADAIAKAGSTDGKAVRDALAASDRELVSGRFRFDSGRDPVKSVAVFKISGGAAVYWKTQAPPASPK